MALLALLKFFERLRVDGTKGFDARAELVVLPLGFGKSFAIGQLFLGGHQLFDGRVQFLAAGFVEIFQLGLFLHQVDFEFRALLVRGLDFGAQALQLLLGIGQHLAHLRLFKRQTIHFGFGGLNLSGECS